MLESTRLSRWKNFLQMQKDLLLDSIMVTRKQAIRFEGTQERAYFISAEKAKGSVILKRRQYCLISTVKK